MSQTVVQPNHPAYRPDIDGLRAVAVLSVLVFHAFPDALPGGFIGVDIFFVISGYLISTILINSISAGRFTFADFYGRRARRIFPALAIVLAASITAGWFILLPTDFQQLGRHVAAGAAFVSNFALWSESGYFDGAAETKILLHLWSLAIEEQFYIVWPILLLVAHRLRIGFGKLLLVAAVLSFAFGNWKLNVDPVAGFFNPLARAWELLVGAGVAYYFSVRRGMVPRTVAQVLAPVGTALIAAGLLVLDKHSTFPGAAALLPTVGAAAIILAGQEAVFSRVVLTNRLMVGVGLISYPLYLWHWPLLAFPRVIEGGTPSAGTRALALAAAVVLAWATYAILEKKLRGGRSLAGKAIGLGAAMALCACAGVAITKSTGLPNRAAVAPYINVDQMLKKAVAWDYAENKACLDRFPSADRKPGWWFCVQSKDSAPTLMIMGNSFANHLYPGIANNPAFQRQTVLQFGTCDPAMSLTFSAYAGGSPCYREGRLKQEQFVNQIILKTPSIKYVVLSAPWPTFNDQGDAVTSTDQTKVDGVYHSTDDAFNGSSYDAFMHGLQLRVAFLADHGITPIIALRTPELGYAPETCYTGQPFRDGKNSCVVPLANELRAQKRFREGVEAIRARYPRLKVFDPLPAICDGEMCNLKRLDGPLLRDQGHLSLAGSDLVGAEFARWAAQNVPEIVSN
ncbi:acyltransferase family protein [Herbaspirillum robiniae]|uniref:acyltransferase family protein n=1 Tax=Herbaspirillum robiniae TaxID=2014887 RepID=UPI0013141191|nr:acyltransferase family protein [Herbaspirillum robiniae]